MSSLDTEAEQKIYDETDDDQLKKGKEVACIFCNVVINAVQKQMEINKKRTRADRYSEDDVLEVLMTLCDNAAGRVANQFNGIRKDAEMICKRVVKEHGRDMMDAASLGEDHKAYCKDVELCEFDFNELDNK